jgi:hypothetical protein
MSKTPTYLEKHFADIADDIRAVQVPCNYGPAKYEVQTIVGLLTIHVYDDWLACRFAETERPNAHFGVRYSDPCIRLNPYSGKWNWHWFECMPHGTKWTKANKAKGSALLLTTFQNAVDRILPDVPVPC